LIACALGAYNWARFGNPFEFGHNYLPEFAEQSEYGQFSLRYVAANVRNILRLPWLENGMPAFPTAFGFAFWLVNPLYVLFAAAFVRRVRRGATAADWLLLIMLAAHFFATLMHKSLGGVQFGTRYLCDLIPAMYCLWVACPPDRPAWRRAEYAAMTLGIAINLYGAWYFHVLVGG
ncbi:MAG: hypothetical protein GX558_01850, partial [Clostridiales bacterium]|nr:hypothetical protein [Clostridiales bacterium]